MLRLLFIALGFILSNLLACTAGADAYSCSNLEPEINLTVGSGSLSRVAPINQEDSQACFAVGMSELIDAQRLRDPNVPTSKIAPINVAVLSPSDVPQKKSRLERGNTSTSFRAIISNTDSLCDQSYLESLLGSFDDQQSYFGTLENMAKIIWQSEMALRHEAPPASSSLAEATLAAQLYFSTPALYHVEPEGGISLFAADWYQILSRYENQDIQTLRDFNSSFDSGLMRPFLQRLCQGHLVDKTTVPALILKGIVRDGFDSHFPIKSEDGMVNYAWSALKTANPQPIGVGFCATMLTKGGFFVPYTYDDRCNQHFAVLAGSRCENNRRQFLIRNSWGPECGDQLATNLKSGCDHRGNLWVDGQNLIRSSFKLVRTCIDSDPGCLSP